MIKLLFSIFFLSTVCLKAKDGFKVIKSDAHSVTLEYTFAGLNSKSVDINGKIYQQLSAKDCVPVLNAGYPQVLRSSVSIALPTNAQPEFEILSSEFTELQNTSIVPSKGSITRDKNPKDIPYEFGSIYQLNKFYPETPAQFNSIYNIRSQEGVSFSIFPVQVNPVTNTVKVYQKLIIKVSYNHSENSKASLQLPDYTSNEEKEILNTRFINLQYLNSKSKTQYSPINEFGSMLVISNPSFTTNIQPLVNWKNQKGIKTQLVTTGITGTSQTSIKNYIQSYYTSNPDLLYVLIVGDHEQVSSFNAGSTGSETKWSDSQYGMILGSDFYPEVMVGRFSGSTSAQINTMVNRTLEYEKNPSIGNWWGKVIGIGSNEGYGIGDEGEADWQHIRAIGTKLLASGYNQFHEFYDSTHAGFDAPGDPNPAMVANAVNTGSSLFIYCGHGDQNTCVTSNYSSSDIIASTNYGKYPFSIQVACNNGTFVGGTCLSEEFVRATGNGLSGVKGAIASCGSTILMAWAEPMDTEDEIGDIVSNMYNGYKNYSLGAIFYNAQMHMIDNYPTPTGEEVMETWVMFGDPSCIFRSASPSAIVASHLNCINANATSFSLNSNAIDTAYVSISQNNQVLGVATVTAGTTSVAITQTINVSQNVLVTITGYNKIPYTSTLSICLVTDVANLSLDAEFNVESIISNELNLNYKNLTAKSLMLELFDLQGKLVNSSTMNVTEKEGSYKMDVSVLSSSLYILKIKDQNNLQLKTVKVIKP